MGFWARRKRRKVLSSDLANVETRLTRERGTREHIAKQQISKDLGVDSVFKKHLGKHDREIAKLEDIQTQIVQELQEL